MSTLSHTTKVAVRKALATLKTADEQRYNIRSITAKEHEKHAQQSAIKAGFRNRADLEQFARRHHLL